MNKTLISILKNTFWFGLALLIFYFVFKDQDFSSFASELKNLNVWWIVFAFVIGGISHLIRAYRWRLLLEPTGHYPSLFSLFYSVIIGYVVNLAIPRAGEVARCTLLDKNSKVPFEVSLGTVIVERLIDVLSLLLIVLLGTIYQYDKIGSIIKDTLTNSPINFQVLLSKLIYLVICLSIIALVIVFLVKKYLHKISTTPFYQKFKKILLGAKEGFLSLRKMKKFPQFIFSTFLMWIFYLAMGWVLFYSFEPTRFLGFDAALAIVIAGSVAFALPVQGGIGSYHFLVSSVLFIYGLDTDSGKKFSVLAHSTNILDMILFGILAFIAGLFIFKSQKKEATK